MIEEYGAAPWIIFPALVTAVVWLASAVGA